MPAISRVANARRVDGARCKQLFAAIVVAIELGSIARRAKLAR